MKSKPPRSRNQLLRARRRRLTHRLRVLQDRSRLLELELSSYTNYFFRVCIFGSARIKPDDELYQLTFKVAEGLGKMGIDVLTGGGPGLMEAANKGVLSGKELAGSKSRSFGITIELNEFEPPSEHLEVKLHHRRFSSRLDDFMRLSNAIIIVPGGIGTVLELFFSWQLIQVGHISRRPIILVNSEFWKGLISWMKEELLGRSLVSPGDFGWIHIVDSPEEALSLIEAEFKNFKTAQERGELAELQTPQDEEDEEDKS